VSRVVPLPAIVKRPSWLLVHHKVKNIPGPDYTDMFTEDPRRSWVILELPRDVLYYFVKNHVPTEDHGCVAAVCREFRDVLLSLDSFSPSPRFQTKVFASLRRCEWARKCGWYPNPKTQYISGVHTHDLELIEHVWKQYVKGHTTGRLRFITEAYRYACTHGHLATMVWLETHLGICIRFIAHECILHASTHGRVDVAEWVFQRASWMTTHHLDDALITTVRRGHLQMMRWLLERPVGVPRLHIAARQAAFYAQRHLLQWLIEQFPLWVLLRDPDHTTYHASVTLIRVYMLRTRDIPFLRDGMQWGIFASLSSEYLHATIFDFYELFPTHDLPGVPELHSWIHQNESMISQHV